jgi:hypothetical protein
VQRRADALGREQFDHGDPAVGGLARGFDRGYRAHEPERLALVCSQRDRTRGGGRAPLPALFDMRNRPDHAGEATRPGHRSGLDAYQRAAFDLVKVGDLNRVGIDARLAHRLLQLRHCEEGPRGLA